MDEIKKYIEKRYDRWMDYSVYHCTRAGIDGEGVDVLNEVLCDLLQKPVEQLQSLLNKKSGQYRELDYFVLRMIKLNATSPTSPYRHRYRSVPVDANVDYCRMEIEDVEDEEDDRPGRILDRMRLVRKTLDELMLPEDVRGVFEFRFFHHESFTDWPGPESPGTLYEIYKKVEASVRRRINGEDLGL